MLLNTLTVEQREVMALVLDGYGPAEIAVLIGATPQAVRQRLSTARRSVVEVWAHQTITPAFDVKDGRHD